ncbi:lpg1661 family Dot/Icm T4SS effector [soil metagenome]
MKELTQEGTPPRLRSLDAYRGLVMLAMASGGLGLPLFVANLPIEAPHSELWSALADQFEHVAWTGCTFWDLIQPSFLFIVGVAMPFSDTKRQEQGQSWGRRLRHALIRSLVLVALGVFLQSQGTFDALKRPALNFEFVNVLAQIGLGYTFVFLVLNRSAWLQLTIALGILLAHWALFFAYPLPARDIDLQLLGVEYDDELLPGMVAHWNKHTNAAAEFDRWFLNRLPRPAGKPFEFNRGGYTTLNFVPSIATMIFGVMAGQWLRSQYRDRDKILWLTLAGAVSIAVGTVLHDAGLCPIVKRIWTPSWVFYSTSWTLWSLAAFYLVIDVFRFRSWTFPLIVVGANSIAMYLMAQLMKGFVRQNLVRIVGPWPFEGTYGPIIEAGAILLVLWLICLYLYVNRIFIKI